MHRAALLQQFSGQKRGEGDPQLVEIHFHPFFHLLPPHCYTREAVGTVPLVLRSKAAQIISCSVEGGKE